MQGFFLASEGALEYEHECKVKFCFAVPDSELRHLSDRLQASLTKEELSALRGTLCQADSTAGEVKSVACLKIDQAEELPTLVREKGSSVGETEPFSGDRASLKDEQPGPSMGFKQLSVGENLSSVIGKVPADATERRTSTEDVVSATARCTSTIDTGDLTLLATPSSVEAQPSVAQTTLVATPSSVKAQPSVAQTTLLATPSSVSEQPSSMGLLPEPDVPGQDAHQTQQQQTQAEEQQPQMQQQQPEEPEAGECYAGTMVPNDAGAAEGEGGATPACMRTECPVDIQAWFWGTNRGGNPRNVPQLPRCASFNPPLAPPGQAHEQSQGGATSGAFRGRQVGHLGPYEGHAAGMAHRPPKRKGGDAEGPHGTPWRHPGRGGHRQHQSGGAMVPGKGPPGRPLQEDAGGGQRKKKKRCGRFVRELAESEAAARDNKVELGFNAHLKQFEKSQRDKGVFQNRKKRATVYTVSGSLAVGDNK